MTGVARSDEAKAVGVPMGAPAISIKSSLTRTALLSFCQILPSMGT